PQEALRRAGDRDRDPACQALFRRRQGGRDAAGTSGHRAPRAGGRTGGYRGRAGTGPARHRVVIACRSPHGHQSATNDGIIPGRHTVPRARGRRIAEEGRMWIKRRALLGAATVALALGTRRRARAATEITWWH